MAPLKCLRQFYKCRDLLNSYFHLSNRHFCIVTEPPHRCDWATYLWLPVYIYMLSSERFARTVTSHIGAKALPSDTITDIFNQQVESPNMTVTKNHLPAKPHTRQAHCSIQFFCRSSTYRTYPFFLSRWFDRSDRATIARCAFVTLCTYTSLASSACVLFAPHCRTCVTHVKLQCFSAWLCIFYTLTHDKLLLADSRTRTRALRRKFSANVRV